MNNLIAFFLVFIAACGVKPCANHKAEKEHIADSNSFVDRSDFDSTSIDFDHDGDLDMVFWKKRGGTFFVFENIAYKQSYPAIRASLKTDFFKDEELFFIDNIKSNENVNQMEIIFCFDGAGGQKRIETIAYIPKVKKWKLVKSTYVTDICDGEGKCKRTTCSSKQDIELVYQVEWGNYIFPTDEDCESKYYKLEE